jgi:RNA polymerase sigma-70 factor, ECF subfamily
MADPDFEHLDDPALVAALCTGTDAALDEAYHRHGGAVWAVARRICRRHDLAEEVCQVVFIELWTRPHHYDPQRGSLRAWLVAGARNRAADAVRSEQSRRQREDRQARLTPTTLDPEPDLDAAAQDTTGLVDHVHQALTRLPESQRQAILLTYFAGHTHDQAARLAGTPKGTIKSRIRLGLDAMRRSLAAEGMNP